MPPLEAWQKVFVDAKKFVESDLHAKAATCIQCHGGVGNTDDMTAAHQGVVRDPSADVEMVNQKCGSCHPDITQAQTKSLHYDSHGYDTIIGQRLGTAPESHAAWEEAKANHCSSCHTTLWSVPRQPTDQHRRRADQRASIQEDPGLHPHLHRVSRLASQR